MENKQSANRQPMVKTVHILYGYRSNTNMVIRIVIKTVFIITPIHYRHIRIRSNSDADRHFVFKFLSRQICTQGTHRSKHGNHFSD